MSLLGLKTAFRALRKTPLISAMNLFGLAVGIAGFLLMVKLNDLVNSMDTYHPDNDRLMIVKRNWESVDREINSIRSWYPLLEVGKENIPEIEETFHIWNGNVWVQGSGPRISVDAAAVDPSLPRVLDIPLSEGDPNSAFSQQRGAVISKELAAKLFGAGVDPVGRVIKVDHTHPFTITGVLAEQKRLTQFVYELYLPAEASINMQLGRCRGDAMDWHEPFSWSFVKLREGADRVNVEEQLTQIAKANLEDPAYSTLKIDLMTFPELYADRSQFNNIGGILILVSGAVLLISLVNFTALSTATAARRAREIGMRKVLGSSRKRLAWQFYLEAALLVLFSLLIALVLVELTMPNLDTMLGAPEFVVENMLSVKDVLRLVPFSLVLIFFAGLYPVLYLSRIPAISVIRNQPTTGRSGHRLRLALVFFQFVFTIGLMGMDLILIRQVDYLESIKLNFDKENIVVIPVSAQDYPDPSVARDRIASLKTQLLALPGVSSVTNSSTVPGRRAPLFMSFERGESGEEMALNLRYLEADLDYYQTFSIPFKEGRLPAEGESDAIVINAKAAELMGEESQIGKVVETDLGAKRIVGVVEDYFLTAPNRSMEPLAQLHDTDGSMFQQYLAIKLLPGDARETLAGIRQTWNGFDPDRDINLFFLDEEYQQLYIGERITTGFIGGVTLLAVLISMLGLLSMVSFAILAKTKEIGVRKVLGATTGRILGLMIRQYSTPVLLANLLAWPLAYLGGKALLSNYPYQSGISPVSFILAGLLALGFAATIIILLTYRAAATNPVESLRTE